MPLKRAEQLQKLSHQHHNGLMAVLLLKKGIAKKASVQVMSEFILHTWENELQTHFALEEDCLHPAALHLPELMPMYVQMRVEHNAIRTIVEAVHLGESSVDLITSFYTLLEKHIRFEERKLFTYIQTNIGSEQFSSLEKSLNGLTAKACSAYPIKFWE